MECRDKSLDKLYKRRSKIDIPEYQREKVWSLEKKRKFIDTILKGWHVPKLYFRSMDPEDQSFECVDGQQRLNAVFEFYEGKISLPVGSEKLYGGLTYDTLKTSYSDTFDDYCFQIEEIEDASDQELEELFLRLQLGTPLNTAEKLNAIGGELRGYIKELADHSFFKDAIGVKNTRFAHFVICCRFFYLEIFKVPNKLRQEELEKMLSDNKKFSRNSSAAKKVKLILGFLYEVFKENSKLLTNRANIVSCYYLISLFKDIKSLNSKVDVFRVFFFDFFTALQAEVEKGSRAKDRDLIAYQDAISRNTDSREAINTRQRILLKYLAQQMPDIFRLLEIPVSERAIIIDEFVDSFKESILLINKNYLAKHGTQKIKYTNEIIAADKILKKLITDEADFGNMIDSLYKLLYEGSGNGVRLLNSNNEVLDDIKSFRLDLRHDIEHSKSHDIRKKSRKISDTYFKYTGKKALSLLDSNDFSILQFSIYSKIADFLNTEKG
ncbi:hypothetical protein A2362_03515 [Candidatus Curtissbacteria bacterium RIFOXYB1_FULL_41_59]|uniref:GmrSD restriction endonucleases N-terminal domain-containing protein n=1 Tax=Candidatus Curtissbacteria bacterium RIFOXYA1_FULL_41_14 TaxID=1797737 RepID=A0A1F5HAE7_9BACT|nr:MAG: hypothetical protein A3E14_01035 [Candidatus Curtissbacteria bacterium RIFCSPHIGHO2_12_FULL_41_13]OGE01137.1 MAG: hypothetical protein A2196_00295 [Candidatus Curtissbacteria bacterium RIFOXYA1_FULL_41_14]OGE04814.1 MAG: hypothetical protein A2362_03515 [Candidatus Curtissbacteria bacterium RIFOXYB1_FULL_41_59]OGE07041.1 MAG: hypothetical protein A2615_02615 [Candidatus Curtissbacteria bacterium RIFOXYD1_FULL_41_36]OGE09463.1 MAG: hypothetical protein A2470_04545 [Candidatus Curtissbact